MIYNILTIAGTDPSGGAGISADLKTFSALGAYGAVVITAVLAQNTHGVDAVHQLSGDVVSQQLQTLFADVRIDAVKIGMLGDADVVRAVADALDRHHPPYVVGGPFSNLNGIAIGCRGTDWVSGTAFDPHGAYDGTPGRVQQTLILRHARGRWRRVAAPRPRYRRPRPWRHGRGTNELITVGYFNASHGRQPLIETHRLHSHRP